METYNEHAADDDGLQKFFATVPEGIRGFYLRFFFPLFVVWRSGVFARADVRTEMDEDDDNADDSRTRDRNTAAHAQYVSVNCVVFTHYTGDVATVVDEHFSRALNADQKLLGHQTSTKGKVIRTTRVSTGVVSSTLIHIYIYICLCPRTKTKYPNQKVKNNNLIRKTP